MIGTMARDPETQAHLEWLGYVQPVGLVVSIPALNAAQAYINRNVVPDHQRFLACLPHDKNDEPIADLLDFAAFTVSVLGWREGDLERVIPGDERYAPLEIALPAFHETLRPTHAVREIEPKDPNNPWLMLAQVLPAETDMDIVVTDDDRHWQAAPHAKFERLLRETQIPIGLLVNGRQIRLVYAPRGETSGYLTFNIADMIQVAGRPIFAGMHMLLCEERLFSLGEKQRLPAILAESRKYQNVVSTKLAEQVLESLYELVRGFQAADDQSKGDLLREVLAADPNHVYGGLLTVLMRLVFVLYAEDRDLISNDPIYTNYYSLTGLFDRLRADEGRYTDTMDQRFGAWAQLLTLFRLVYEGGGHGGFKIPPRHGYLFDPDRYNFLEGRPWKTARAHHEGEVRVPRISDGVIYRVLKNLLILDGERLSYRTLDVEQIGSVYETMMGFNLEVARGRSIAVKPKKTRGAPSCINLDELLATKGADRDQWLRKHADQKLTDKALTAMKKAVTIDDLIAALDSRIACKATPNVVSAGSMVLQPSDERRKSGSHYTPRSLTEPIVRTTLKPILDQLGPQPLPDQILELKICDPAMGSGAFLVEACRQLGEELVKAWHAHNCVPNIPPDEDEILHARRIVAQRCLYGVDKNPFAVDLAKLSLWLVTLAKDHPFTFLDHALRCGDSLVGLNRKQMICFNWNPQIQQPFLSVRIWDMLDEARRLRKQIEESPECNDYSDQNQLHEESEANLNDIRLLGDSIVAAFFAECDDKKRIKALHLHEKIVQDWLSRYGDRSSVELLSRNLTIGDFRIVPFHWDVEFPEVFRRPIHGFDVVVGNPPFIGGRKLRGSHGDNYFDWLLKNNVESSGNADLVSFFFRRSFEIIRDGGSFGLIATNTIGQGDTRSTGLRWICNHGGSIFSVTRRRKWPGLAAVVVSIIHVLKSKSTRFPTPTKYLLDGKTVERITAFLFQGGANEDPTKLKANESTSFQGSIVLGMGFTFDDTDKKGVANSLALMNELISKDPRNAERIFPYIGGEEVNDSPTHSHHRYVINFGDMTEEEARRWPDLMRIVEDKVKPERTLKKPNGEFALRKPLPQKWWIYADKRPALYSSIAHIKRVLVISRIAQHGAFVFLSNGMVYSEGTIVFADSSYHFFSLLQSRPHEIWARFFGSSMKDDLRYTPSDCFETFPFPKDFENNSVLESNGKDYYEFRAALMIKNNEGLTKTYNRFHDPNERSPDIHKLRELHAAMDRAVLDAYGWTDLNPTCEFILDYEDEEDDDDETPSKRRRRKKPWRYRWPDDFRDEVLARLLELNRVRAEEERLSGIASENSGKKPAKKSTKGRKTGKKESDQPELFEK